MQRIKDFISDYWPIIIFLMSVVSVAVTLILRPPSVTQPEPQGPSIYIINTRLQLDFYNNHTYVIQYAIDGRVEHAVFYSGEDMDRYKRYLETIGNVITWEECK